MDSGNLAIRDHVKNRKELLLFEAPPRRKVKYVGSFTCADVEEARGPDKEGRDRLIYQFVLVPEGGALSPLETEPTLGATLGQLREQAEKGTESGGKTTTATRKVYVRSEAVRAYVLVRAGGTCEFCGDPAPFNRPSGEAYLEPHHIKRLSDGGPDDLRQVIGACPNCHRRAHYGADPTGIAAQMRKRVGEIEIGLAT